MQLQTTNYNLQPRHIPVLLQEVLDGLAPAPNDNVVDCTVGAGGHSAAILERTAPNGKLLGFDLDEAALDAARKTLSRFGSRAMLVRANYRDLARMLRDEDFGPVQAALLDLGFSSIEIDDPTRGFSFRFDGPLDMRYDRSQTTTAAEIVNGWNEDDLANVIWKYGEEHHARRIAKAIVHNRTLAPIVGTFQLVEVIHSAVPPWYRRGRLHFATKTFQALRIATNDELGSLQTVLPQLVEALGPGGRVAVISFHSLEDRIVKEFFKSQAAAGELEIVTKRPITASSRELRDNPRSRSAKLRIAKKVNI